MSAVAEEVVPERLVDELGRDEHEVAQLLPVDARAEARVLDDRAGEAEHRREPRELERAAARSPAPRAARRRRRRRRRPASGRPRRARRGRPPRRASRRRTPRGCARSASARRRRRGPRRICGELGSGWRRDAGGEDRRDGDEAGLRGLDHLAGRPRSAARRPGCASRHVSATSVLTTCRSMPAARLDAADRAAQLVVHGQRRAGDRERHDGELGEPDEHPREALEVGVPAAPRSSAATSPDPSRPTAGRRPARRSPHRVVDGLDLVRPPRRRPARTPRRPASGSRWAPTRPRARSRPSSTSTVSSHGQRRPGRRRGQQLRLVGVRQRREPGRLPDALEAEAHGQLAEQADRRVLDLDVLRGRRRELGDARGDAALGAGQPRREAVVDVARQHDDRMVRGEAGEQILVVGAGRPTTTRSRRSAAPPCPEHARTAAGSRPRRARCRGSAPPRRRS